MKKFRSNRKAEFLLMQDVDVKAVFDEDTDLVLWMVDNEDYKYVDAELDYVDCIRGVRDVYVSYSKLLKVKSRMNDLIYRARVK